MWRISLMRHSIAFKWKNARISRGNAHKKGETARTHKILTKITKINKSNKLWVDYIWGVLYNTREGSVSSTYCLSERRYLDPANREAPERFYGRMTQNSRIYFPKQESNYQRRKYLKRANHAKAWDAKLRGLKHWAHAHGYGSPAANISVYSFKNERRTK